MLPSRSCLCRLLILCVSVKLVCADVIGDKMYETIDAQPCVRLFNKKGPIGCSTPKSGSDGLLRLAQTQSQIDNLIFNPPAESIVAVMAPQLFNKQNVARLHGNTTLQGIIITKGARPSAYSPESPFSLFEDTYQWNPQGDGLSYLSFEYGIVTLAFKAETSSRLTIERASKNEEEIARGKYAPYAAILKYPIFSTHSDNSMLCLASAKCIPVGGYSVWSALGELNSTTREWVLATSTVDSSAFFHDNARGANGHATGLIASLAAQHALSALFSTTPPPALPKTIVFAMFAAESWSAVGSRKFVDDLVHFKCHSYGDDDKKTCSIPFKPSLMFQQLNIQKLSRLLDLSQIGLNSSAVFAHRQRDATPETQTFFDHLQLISQTMGTHLSVLNASKDTPGIPPSPARAFYAAKADLPVLVLADHFSHYVNKFYHSEYDDFDNLQSNEPISNVISHICRVATITARALFESAGGAVSISSSIQADCDLVSQLVHCFLETPSCAFFRSFLPDVSDYYVTHYMGVYQLMQPRYISGLSKLLFNYISSLNSTFQVFYHDAVDPGLEFDYELEQWKVSNTTDTMLWTESNWPSDIQTQIYRRENPSVEATMIVFGVLSLLLSLAIVYVIHAKWCATHFKSI
eukprot:TRINITY_DN2302_c0_g1_i1.p1 TRINITY_DN2302_c0_g1~~TRINITY_DN2302_c0_g1_i1.p1  ORF type:complete len:634 (-),score=83.30 TRINITY_DN2302_c0_g1_i1:236-2137(-)